MQQHEGLADLFVDTLRDIYSAEKQILRSLPKMARAAASAPLREAFLAHRDQTEDQIGRLDRVFELIGERAGRKTCEAMQGILEEGDETIADYAGSEALDAGLIASGQAVEHYEISRYTALRDWADALGLREAVSLLAETLNEEKETDRILTEIAESSVNEQAEGDVGKAAGTTPGVRAKTGTTRAKPEATAGKASASTSTSGRRNTAAKPATRSTAAQAGGASSSATTARQRPAAPSSLRQLAGAKQEKPTAAGPAVSGTPSAPGSAQSGGSQKSPGTLGGRTAGDDDVPAATRSPVSGGARS